MVALAILGAIAAVPIIIALSSIFNGYALCVLWGWFMVPTFGLPKISIPAAIGIALVIRYLTREMSASKSDEEGGFKESLLMDILIAILQPSFALFFGWIVHLYM